MSDLLEALSRPTKKYSEREREREREIYKARNVSKGGRQRADIVTKIKHFNYYDEPYLTHSSCTQIQTQNTAM